MEAIQDQIQGRLQNYNEGRKSRIITLDDIYIAFNLLNKGKDRVVIYKGKTYNYHYSVRNDILTTLAFIARVDGNVFLQLHKCWATSELIHLQWSGFNSRAYGSKTMIHRLRGWTRYPWVLNVSPYYDFVIEQMENNSGKSRRPHRQLHFDIL